jgi:hypothetical protein
MKINRLHSIIGLLFVLMPFTGFTRGFKDGFFVLGGAVILYLAMMSIYSEITKKQSRAKRHDSFVENKPKDTQVSAPILKVKREPKEKVVAVKSIQNIVSPVSDIAPRVEDSQSNPH